METDIQNVRTPSPCGELRQLDFIPGTVFRYLQGNEACVEGALYAGLGFYAGYPITPSSEIAEILSHKLPREGKSFIQMEDEIASLAACLGAALGGAKTMTATSGPGFSLMQENIGYAVMAEIPVVIVNVQRMGPSTGQASSPAQGDVMQARWGTHGDHPIIVLAPSSVKECFLLTVKAFNFAEKYRTPVILLSDEVVGHMREKIPIPPRDALAVEERPTPPSELREYKPYEVQEGDVPPLASFGDGHRFHVTGLLHDESGYPTLVPAEMAAWYDRVFHKIDGSLDDILMYECFDCDDAEVLIVSFGCSARSALGAQRLARRQGIRAGFLKLMTIWPFPEEVVRNAARNVRKVVVPELNLGQLRHQVCCCLGNQVPVAGVNRMDGEVLTPGQILDALR